MVLGTAVFALIRLMGMKRVAGVKRMRIGRSRWSGGVVVWPKLPPT
jgi:hypothetical protein